MFDFTQYDYVIDAIDTVAGKLGARYAGKRSGNADNMFDGSGQQA